MRRILLTALLLVCTSTAWAAPTVDDAGAAALKPRVAETLKAFADTFKRHGFLLNQTGDLTVEAAGTYYAITTPSLSLAFPTGVTRTIGMLAINAVPTDNPDIIKVALALPTPMLDTGPDGKPMGETTIGNQSLSGLWHFVATSFVQLDARYADIFITNTADGSKTHIPALAIAMNLRDNGQGKWSGPSNVVASKISHTKKDQTYKLANLQIKSAVTGLDVKKRASLPASENNKAGGTAPTLDTLLAQSLAEVAEGFDSSIDMSGLSIISTAQNTSFDIKKITLATAMQGLLTPAPASSWDMLIEGVTTPTQTIQPYLPSIVQVKGSAKGVALADMLNPKMDTLAKEGALTKLERLVIDAPKYGLEASGNFGMTGKAMDGGLNVSLRGVADLLSWLSSPDSKSAGAAQLPAAITGVLGMVQMMGKQGTDAQGRNILTYDFKFSPDGKLTLNGADFSGMFGGGAAGGTTPAAPHSAPSVQAAP